MASIISWSDTANATTKADGLRVPHPFADYLILDAIRATGGTALAVSDQDMINAMYEMATAMPAEGH